MDDLINLENYKQKEINKDQTSRFSDGGIHVREDDQDWGSSGMNDIQKQSDIS